MSLSLKKHAVVEIEKVLSDALTDLCNLRLRNNSVWVRISSFVDKTELDEREHPKNIEKIDITLTAWRNTRDDGDI